jgi:hypothetical protein
VLERKQTDEVKKYSGFSRFELMGMEDDRDPPKEPIPVDPGQRKTGRKKCNPGDAQLHSCQSSAIIQINKKCDRDFRCLA